MTLKLFLFVVLFSFSSFLFSQEKRLVVYFKNNQYAIDKIHENKIDSFLRQYDVIKEVLIEAHCDSIGNHTYNDELSQKRAEEIKRIVVIKNIPADKIKINALGKRKLVNDNADENLRALNRYAEVFIVTEEKVNNVAAPVMVDSAVIKKEEENKKRLLEEQSRMLATNKLAKNIHAAEIGSSVRLENVNFPPGRHVLTAQSELVVLSLVGIMKTFPDWQFEIQGHICCLPRGDGPDSETGKPNLSEARAKEVYKFLVKNGINASRLSYKGYGANHKLVQIEKTEEDKAQNRRVEIKVLQK